MAEPFVNQPVVESIQYLGNANRDGSWRFRYAEALGTLSIDKRLSGSWTEAIQFDPTGAMNMLAARMKNSPWVDITHSYFMNLVRNDDWSEAFNEAAKLNLPILVPPPPGPFTYYGIKKKVSLTESCIGIGMPHIRSFDSLGSIDRPMFEMSGYSGKEAHIAGMYLEGDHAGVLVGEHSHAISILTSKNVHIHDIYSDLPWGDNLYIGGTDPCENIHVYHNQFKGPRRCNIAVISAKELYIHHNLFTGLRRYVAAIDLEANNNGPNYILDCNIKDNVFDTLDRCINIYSTHASVYEKVHVSGNKATTPEEFLRITDGTTGQVNGLKVDKNEFYGLDGGANNSMFYMVDGMLYPGAKFIGNEDHSGKAGWYFKGGVAGRQKDLTFIANEIDIDDVANLRSGAIAFNDVDNITFRDNKIKMLTAVVTRGLLFSSSLGVGSKGHIIEGNRIESGNTGITFNGNGAVLDTIIDKNIIDAVTAIVINAGASGSDIKILQDNIYVQGGVAGTTNILYKYGANNNLGDDVRNTFGSAPPTTEYHQRGSFRRNELFSLGGTGGIHREFGWICAVAGTPGTWCPIWAFESGTVAGHFLKWHVDGYPYWSA